MSRVYLSGQISSYPDGVEAARDRFKRYERCIAALMDYEVVNPFEVDVESCEGECGGEWTGGPNKNPHSWSCWMKADIRALLTCERIIMLPGWELSPGARKEFDIATTCGLPVIYMERLAEIDG